MQEDLSYVEKGGISLPSGLENGPTGIGDLWDCHESRAVPGNLFSGLTVDDFEIDNIQQVDYQLTHVKSTKDRVKNVDVNGELSLEFLGGLIKVSGQASYDNKESGHFLEEELECSYKLTNHAIQTKTTAYVKMDELMKTKILKREIKATHVVRKLFVGASWQASLKITDTSSSSDMKASGSVLGTLSLGPVNASLKVGLGFLDAETTSDVKTTINIRGFPAPKRQPKNVSEMFEIIESISDVISTVTPSTIFERSSNVNGVAVRLFLVPISEFLDTKVEVLYMKIKDDTLEQLEGMFSHLRDLQRRHYLTKQIINKQPKLKRIIMDPQNSLVQEITNYELELQKESKTLYRKAVKCLSNYKIGKSGVEDLLGIQTECHRQLSIVSINVKIEDFVKRGRQELIGIAESTVTNEVQVITNKESMKEWLQQGRENKILFQASIEGASFNQLMKLYDISPDLLRVGVKIAVTTPTMDGINLNSATLTVKTKYGEKVYDSAGISHVVRILGVIVNKEPEVVCRFFTVLSSRRGIKLPLSAHLDDLVGLTQYLKPFKDIKFATTYFKLTDILTSGETKHKAVVTMECLNNIADIVATLDNLRINLDRKIELIVGTFEIPQSQAMSSPLMFLFHGETLKSVCYNNLDLCIFRNELNDSRNGAEEYLGSELVLNIDNIRQNCWEASVAKFVSRVIKKVLNADEKRIDKTDISRAFAGSSNPLLSLVAQVFGGCLSKDKLLATNTLTSLMLHEFPELVPIAKQHGWNDTHKTFIELAPIKRIQFIEHLRSFLATNSPFRMKIENSQALIDKGENIVEELKESIRTITEDVTCPLKLKQKLTILLDKEDGLAVRESLNYYLKEYLSKNTDSSDESFTAVALEIKLLENNDDENNIVNFIPAIADHVFKLIEDPAYTTLIEKWNEMITDKRYYELLCSINSASNGICYYQLQQLVREVQFPTSKDVGTFFHSLSKLKLSENQLKSLFHCYSIQHLLNDGIKSSPELKQIFEEAFCVGEVPKFIPEEIRKQLSPLLESTEINLGIPEFLSIEDFLIIGSRLSINTECEIPEEFVRSILQTTAEDETFEEAVVANDSELRATLKDKTEPFSHTMLLKALENADRFQKIKSIPQVSENPEGAMPVAPTPEESQPVGIQWVPMEGGQHPPFAIQAGNDQGSQLFVIRASHEGGMIPGKLHDGHLSAHVGYDGQEICKPQYEVLISPVGKFSWVDCCRTNIPPNAIQGGSDPNGDIYYIGRIHLKGTVTVGKVHARYGKCYVPYGGIEHESESFEVLVQNL